MTFARSVPFLLAAALLQISCSDDDPVSTTLTGSWTIVAATGPAFSSSTPVRLPALHFSADGTFFLLSDVRDEDTACEMEVNAYACRSHETVDEDTLDPGYSCSNYGSCGTYTLAPVSAEATRAAPEATHELSLVLDRHHEENGWTPVTLRWAVSFSNTSEYRSAGRPVTDRQVSATPLPLDAASLALFQDAHWIFDCHESTCTQTLRQFQTACVPNEMVYWEPTGDYGEHTSARYADHVSHCF